MNIANGRVKLTIIISLRNISEIAFHNHSLHHSRKKNMSQKWNLHKYAAKTGSGAGKLVLFY